MFLIIMCFLKYLTYSWSQGIHVYLGAKIPAKTSCSILVEYLGNTDLTHAHRCICLRMSS